jgi:hypothetical protein
MNIGIFAAAYKNIGAIFWNGRFLGCLQKKNGADFSRSIRQWFLALRTKRKVV